MNKSSRSSRLKIKNFDKRGVINMNFPQYHKSLGTLHHGAEKERSYFIPYDSFDAAAVNGRNISAYFTSLCGLWGFKFYNSFEDISEDFYAEDYDTSPLAKEKVPACFQLYDSCKFDRPIYTNLMYPFPTDPPHVPDKNPCAAYLRDIDVSDEMLKRDNIITFEGVGSCFYLWVNGKFVGYSQVSRSTSEFDISALLKVGRNRIAVLVVKWCDGSYLEDQDAFKLSGIFREVYMLSRCKERIEDFQIIQSFSDDFSEARLSVNCLTKGKPAVNYRLVSPDGVTVCEGKGDSGVFEIAVNNPLMWNDETPYLYKLFIAAGDEIIPVEIALCEVRIEDKKLLINGKAVKLRGINRHDSSAENGYAVTMAEMERDLHLLKRASVNAIRTSHYPNDPRFMDMAQRLGFYMIDEADLETHGMGYNTEADWDWTRWSSLSNSPEWRDAYVDRARRLYERDKNYGCVVMWSLGNESGCGVNHRAMREYIKSRNKNALVHYENAHLEFKSVPEGECFADISDVESRMYPSAAYSEEYLNSDEYNKPFYMCEYVCSMTTGDVYDFWELVDKYENFCGGCIWEFCDHAVNIPDKNGKPRYLYGGDFGDFPNDGICCIDGLVFPDRSPRPGYYDMKKVYEPFRGAYEAGVLTVKSVRYFTPLSDLCVHWSLTEDGSEIASGEIDSLDVPPQGEKDFRLFNESDFCLRKNAFLTVSIRTINETRWAEKGYEVGFLQFELPREAAKESCEKHTLSFKEGARFVTINSGENEYVFDKSYGRLSSITRSGTELLEEPSKFKIWRAPSYNRGSVKSWLANHFDHVAQKTYSAEITTATADEIVITTEIALGGPANPPCIKMTVSYAFCACGRLNITASGTVRENLPLLPRLGIELVMPENNENICYFGLGETETYPDRYKAARFGKYSLTVSDNFVHYIRPQENSSHYKTRYAVVGENGGHGLKVTGYKMKDFSFNASHYSAEQLTTVKHDFELVNERKTIFNIDWRFNAMSESAELDNDINNRLLDDKVFSFGFTLEPIDM